jgi:hypothetical protein
MGTFYLQEAVLDVLYEQYEEGYGLGAADISRRAGIYRDRGPSDIMNDAIVHGVLNSLEEQKKVERVAQEGGRGGWRLTKEEYERRRTDV